MKSLYSPRQTGRRIFPALLLWTLTGCLNGDTHEDEKIVWTDKPGIPVKDKSRVSLGEKEVLIAPDNADTRNRVNAKKEKPFSLFGNKSGGSLFDKSDPDEDLWAVRCITLEGPQQFQVAKSYAEALKKVQGLKSELVQVFSDDDGTAIYYGKYRRDYDAATAKETYSPDHMKDLNLIHQLSVVVANQTVWPFLRATMDSLPTTQLEHAEWDLAKADGYWSLQVGVFYNSGEFKSRKKGAVEYCKELRAKGEEAYFHHGPTNSSVCIGLFPEKAIVDIQREDPLSGRLIPASRIVDERLLDLQKKYPVNLENGHQMYDIQRDPATGQVKERVPRPSFPVKIPRAEKQRTTRSLTD